MSDSLTVTRTVRGTPAEASRCFTHATALRDWLCDSADVQPRPGGRLSLAWRDGHTARGVFSTIDPGKRLAFSWDHDAHNGSTAVEVKFAAAKAGTRVTVKHSGLGEASEELRAAWVASLENLDSLLADGIDLRAVRRPRLGIFLNDDGAAPTKTRTPQGIRLGGTVPGSGAAEAGLQQNDILVTFDNAPLTRFEDLVPLLSRHKAGDVVTVTYLRAGQSIDASLALGSFPAPRLPATAAALAKYARGVHKRINSELAKLTKGLSEARAARPPRKGEWSVNQQLAHLILAERDMQSWAGKMLSDEAVEDDLGFGTNEPTRVNAVVARFKTLAALRRELALAQEETALLAEGLPRDFVTKRKHLFRRFAGRIFDITPGHWDDDHAPQIKDAMAVK